MISANGCFDLPSHYYNSKFILLCLQAYIWLVTIKGIRTYDTINNISDAIIIIRINIGLRSLQ